MARRPLPLALGSFVSSFCLFVFGTTPLMLALVSFVQPLIPLLSSTPSPPTFELDLPFFLYLANVYW